MGVAVQDPLMKIPAAWPSLSLMAGKYGTCCQCYSVERDYNYFKYNTDANFIQCRNYLLIDKYKYIHQTFLDAIKSQTKKNIWNRMDL